MSSFLCVTDAPNDVINHDTTPFVRIKGSGIREKTYRLNETSSKAARCTLNTFLRTNCFHRRSDNSLIAFDCLNCASLMCAIDCRVRLSKKALCLEVASITDEVLAQRISYDTLTVGTLAGAVLELFITKGEKNLYDMHRCMKIRTIYVDILQSVPINDVLLIADIRDNFTFLCL